MSKRYIIRVSKQVDKFLSRHLDIAKKFVKILEILQHNPLPGELDIKALKGKKSHYRLRIGKYRFLYEIIGDKILIYFYKAGPRGEIDKK